MGTVDYYIIVARNQPIFNYGPFDSPQARNDFACALWFGKPARKPGSKRGHRILFNRYQQNMYYVQVSNGLMSNIRDVTVGDLSQGACFPRD